MTARFYALNGKLLWEHHAPVALAEVAKDHWDPDVGWVPGNARRFLKTPLFAGIDPRLGTTVEDWLKDWGVSRDIRDIIRAGAFALEVVGAPETVAA